MKLFLLHFPSRFWKKTYFCINIEVLITNSRSNNNSFIIVGSKLQHKKRREHENTQCLDKDFKTQKSGQLTIFDTHIKYQRKRQNDDDPIIGTSDINF